MADIVLFHSVLGVRPGIHEAAHRLRAEGHDVVVVDQYGGRVFDDYEEAGEFADSIGFPALMRIAEDAVNGVPDGFIAAGFSNGGGMAEFVAT
ncbi:MAG: dienelactone hydrolase, partial [Actinomycetota bacterium]|nr:dienelactone hydrolase [Actinomycetota bacterium]